MNEPTPSPLVVPIGVRRVALTSLDTHPVVGPRALLPVVGVWVDDEVLDASGFTGARDEVHLLPVLAVTEVLASPDDPAIVNLVISPLVDSSRAETGTRAWLLRLPSTHVALVHALASSASIVRMVVVDGPVPQSPESHVIAAHEARAVIWPEHASMPAALAASLAPEWAASGLAAASPPVVGSPEAVDLSRDQIWAATGGVALGQRHAFNRAISLAHWFDSEEPGTRAATRRQEGAVLAQRLLTNSGASAWVRDDGTFTYPAQMAGLLDDIEHRVPPLAYAAIARGFRFADLVDLVGHPNAVLAVISVAAAAAVHTLDHDPHAAPSGVAYLLAQWLSVDPHAEPWWAMRATYHLLPHHDTDVLVDLLAPTRSAGPVPALLHRWLHVLTEALSVSTLTAEQLALSLPHLDIRLPGIEAIEEVCAQLLNHHAFLDGTQECGPCAVVEAVLPLFSDRTRLARAAAGALPVLADLQAELDDREVGSEEWRTQRLHYLRHWLNRTAVASRAEVHGP